MQKHHPRGAGSAHVLDLKKAHLHGEMLHASNDAGTATPEERALAALFDPGLESRKPSSNLVADWTELTEADLELRRLDADVENNRGKAERRARRDYNAAVRLEGGSEQLGGE